MRLWIYKICSFVFTTFLRYKNRVFSVLLCIGLLCFVLAVANSEQPIHNSMVEEEVLKEQVSVESSISTNEVEEIEDIETDVSPSIQLEDIEYGYLFEDFSKQIDSNNVLLTYTSVPFKNEHNQPLTVSFGKQGVNQTFAVYTNNLKFELYNLSNSLYASIESENAIKLYKVEGSSQTSHYWNSLYSDTSNLVDLLNNIDYDELNYAGETVLDNRSFVKLVAEKHKVVSENSIDSDTNAYANVFAIKPAIELVEVDLEEDDELTQEVIDTINTDTTLDSLASLDSFNVLTQPGHFVFYFDEKGLKLKRLYIRNENSITTITMEPLYSIKLPETVNVEEAEVIEDDKLGRLMLSSIFAMVSDTELNELTKELD